MKIITVIQKKKEREREIEREREREIRRGGGGDQIMLCYIISTYSENIKYVSRKWQLGGGK